jgi:TonB family protein
LQSGCEIEHYQFHLLQLSYSKAAAKITNNFNVSPLKKRILMMNKKQTSLRGIWKYALLIPVVILLVFFNSSLKAESPVLASIQKGINENAPLADKTPTAVEANVNDDVLPKKETIEFTPPKNTQKEEAQEEKTNKAPIFSQVETPPSFPGGIEGMLEYLKNNMKYPESAVKNGIQGRVVVRFVVDSTGKVTNVEVIRSLDPACDAEAIRVVEAMPDWIPGKQSGNPVSVYYTLPILFSLDDKTPVKEEKIDQLKGIPENMVIIIDGKIVSRYEMSKLSSENIEKIEVNKETTAINITTKK